MIVSMLRTFPPSLCFHVGVQGSIRKSMKRRLLITMLVDDIFTESQDKLSFQYESHTLSLVSIPPRDEGTSSELSIFCSCELNCGL